MSREAKIERVAGVLGTSVLPNVTVREYARKIVDALDTPLVYRNEDSGCGASHMHDDGSITHCDGGLRHRGPHSYPRG